MQVQTGVSSNHLKSRVVNELPCVGRFKIGRAHRSRLRNGARYKALQTLYPDSDVAMRVLQALKGRHYTTLNELEVSVHQSVATITGLVNSFYEKQVAMSACHDVPGVLRLIDRIGVCEHSGDRK